MYSKDIRHLYCIIYAVKGYKVLVIVNKAFLLNFFNLIFNYS